MKHRWIGAGTLATLLGLGIFGATAVSAHGMMGMGFFGIGSTATPDEIATRQQTMFNQEAEVTGLSVDDIKNAWAQGKGLQQLMTEHNITPEQVQARVKDAQLAQLKTTLAALVSKGIITQAQADARLQFVQNQKPPTRGMLRGGRGPRGFGFGWRF